MGIQIDGPGRVVLTTATGPLLLELDPERWHEHGPGLHHGGVLEGCRAGLWALRDGRFELVLDLREPNHRPHQGELQIAAVATLLDRGPGFQWAKRKLGEAALATLADAEAALRQTKRMLAELGAVLDAMAEDEASSRAA